MWIWGFKVNLLLTFNQVTEETTNMTKGLTMAIVFFVNSALFLLNALHLQLTGGCRLLVTQCISQANVIACVSSACELRRSICWLDLYWYLAKSVLTHSTWCAGQWLHKRGYDPVVQSCCHKPPQRCSGRLAALSSPVSSQCIFLPFFSFLVLSSYCIFLCLSFPFCYKFPDVSSIFINSCVLSSLL